MPIHPTYPGVYVQEEPSGVRTITGVSTSIATFIGRTKMGPMLEPILCLNFTEFERTFSAVSTMSELANSVRLFFLNGGSQCYIVRIAAGALKASITLKNEAGASVVKMTAKSAGLIGNTIRVAVTYNGAQPEALFNLEIFRWEKNAAGISVKKDTEIWTSLSMNPLHSRYAQTYISQNSQLVNLEDLMYPTVPGTNGYSQSGPIPKGTLTAALSKKQFRISVDGGLYMNVDLGSRAFDLAVPADLTVIKDIINTAIAPTATITVTAPVVTGTHHTLKIESTKGDVFVQPASTDDISNIMMLGTAQGGIEVSKYADYRPVPNGLVLKGSKIAAFAVLPQSAFKNLTIAGVLPPIAFDPQTTAAADAMYQDAFSNSVTGNSDGVREKWVILADSVNGQKDTNPTFPWTAEVWGSRFAILPNQGIDNSKGTLLTAGGDGTNIGADFTENVRYYSLGSSGTSGFQVLGGGDGDDGAAPKPKDYKEAYEKIDKEVDIFNLLLLPRDEQHSAAETRNLWGEASAFCQKRRAFMLMDPPDTWKTVQNATNLSSGVNFLRQGIVKTHSAIFYPRLIIQDNGLEKPIGATGAIAGLMARTDSNRGVWKAAAGTEADIRGVSGLEHRFSDDENGVLNPHAVNTLRIFPNGIVNWGARTMDGDDDFGSEWKYIPVRRTALFIEESLYRGLKWTVFEPNDEPLWSQIRLNVGAFMYNLFRQGAFQGQQKKDAYFVKCDSETTTQNDINLGIVNVWVGFAPLKPAEFVILHLQQMTGQIQV